LVDLGTPTLNTTYNVFIVRTDVGGYEIRTDTDVDGLNLTGITHKRWLGFVRANSSGAIVPFIQNGDEMAFEKDNSLKLPDAGASNTLLDASALIPMSRIEAIGYTNLRVGTTDGQAYYMTGDYSGDQGRYSVKSSLEQGIGLMAVKGNGHWCKCNNGSVQNWIHDIRIKR
jgi:hypothetical protein